ncbi:MAG: leucyl aminopeptidase family protein [Desulfovibrionaceae bacterium]
MNIIECGTNLPDVFIAFSFEDDVQQGIAGIPKHCFVPENTKLNTEFFNAEANKHTMLFGTKNSPLQRTLLVGLGKKPKTYNELLHSLRHAAGTGIRHARDLGFKKAAFSCSNIFVEMLPTFDETTSTWVTPAEKERILYSELAYAVEAALYKYSLKTDDSDKKMIETFFFTNDACNSPEILDAVRKGTRIGKATSFVRDLVNTPANLLKPMDMVEKAKEVAKEQNLKLTVLTMQDMKNKGMNAFVSVAQGSAAEPALIALEYAPKGKENEAPIAIVGKGITFDSGGISLKPANNMHEMKGDMAGAATALGLGLLLDKFIDKRVILVLACAENMPSSTASRPGDVVKTLKGLTVEILNTDAEGRLVLCDAMTWVQQKYKPRAIIDMATLTGACVMALGEELTGLFTNSDELSRNFKYVGKYTGEECWRLPTMKHFVDDIKGTISDLQNIGKSRYAGATTAAVFLEQFVEEGVTWAHLDIAGTASSSIKNPLTCGGATGMPLRLLFTMLALDKI